MLKLSKGPAPEWLVTHGPLKTEEYLAAEPDHRPAPWNPPALKSALAEECHHKCMYCEAIPADTSYLAVEHIQPKSRFPDLVLEWSNLGWSCTRCNTNKGDFWPEDASLRLIDPFVDDPSEHIAHAGPMVIAANDSMRGASTIRKCDLNRKDLMYSKFCRIQDLDRALLMWSSASSNEIREALAEDVITLLSAEAEFAAALRAFAALRDFDTSDLME